MKSFKSLGYSLDDFILKKFILLITIIFILISCGEKKVNSSSINQKKLFVKKNVSIPIKNDIHYKSWQIHIQEKDDTTYLIRKNYYTNSIIVYNWDTRKRIKSYTFKSEGQNSVTKFDSSGFIEVEDGLFFIGTGRSKIYLVKNDSVIFKENLDNTGKVFGKMLNGFNKNLPILLGDYVYMFRKPPVKREDKSYYDYNLLIKSNLKTKTTEECSVKYPILYKAGDCWGFQHLRQSFTLNNLKEIIFSFPIDPNLYKYDIDTDSLTKIPVDLRSSFKTTFNPMPCKDITNEEYEYFVKASTSYESIKYDKYKDVYYRIVLFKPDNLSKTNAINLEYKVSIMTLDSNFKIIAEDMFNNGIYDFDDFFITKEGLWLSTNNPNNPNFNEDVMSFDLLTLIEKK